ncbi:hypothetical protein Cfor_09426 [Coptotermes formosanus]|uniref:Uncharacterized protein n=1 Tax=Coptotermes formosanus TaxID=36987 RepID=A0A6L2Q1N3_COPFO|nr:hypothetical protein Cfor_09426 [Coptotermes formosanus]
MSFILQSSCCLCRYLVFEGKAANSVTSVELHQVKTLGVARDPDAGTSSVEIVYTQKGKEPCEQRVKLCSGPEPHRKLANAWIDAIQQNSANETSAWLFMHMELQLG